MIKPLDSYNHVPHATLPHVLDTTNIREIQVLGWVGHENRAITDLSTKKNNLSTHDSFESDWLRTQHLEFDRSEDTARV